VTLIVVDAANVVGSRPDGWWRDRAGATRRLRDSLVGRAEDIILVVEGRAREVASVPGVEVVAASHSGDDAIVEVVRARGSTGETIVVTADRALRERVTALGAQVVGPRWLTASS
jgi:hypothetical protein